LWLSLFGNSCFERSARKVFGEKWLSKLQKAGNEEKVILYRGTRKGSFFFAAKRNEGEKRSQSQQNSTIG